MIRNDGDGFVHKRCLMHHVKCRTIIGRGDYALRFVAHGSDVSKILRFAVCRDMKI